MLLKPCCSRINYMLQFIDFSITLNNSETRTKRKLDFSQEALGQRDVMSSYMRSACNVIVCIHPRGPKKFISH